MNRWPADREAVPLLVAEVLGCADFAPDDTFRISVIRFAELAQSYRELLVIMGGEPPGPGVSPLDRSELPRRPEASEAPRLAQEVHGAGVG